MNKINEWFAYILGWKLDDLPIALSDDDDDAYENSLVIQKDATQHIKELEYMEILQENENFQLDATKNVCFIIVDSKQWEKGSDYFVDGGVRLYSRVPLKEFAKLAFRYEIETVAAEGEFFVHNKRSDDCLFSRVITLSQSALISSKKFAVIAIVLHDDPVSVLTNEIAYSTKQRFRKGIVYSDVTDGMRSVLLNRPINKLRDLYTPVNVYLKTRSAHRGESRFIVDDDAVTIADLKLQAKKNAIEEKSKLDKIKI